MSVIRQVANRKLCLSALLVSLLCFWGSHPMSTQVVYGSVYGTVVDASGAVVPNASVTVTNQAKGITLKGQTDGAGQYRVEHLIPDVYTVTVSASGFKSFSLTGVQVNAGDSPRVDATLTIGSAS